MLVGGTAELRDIAAVGREMLGLPVRVGVPSGAIGLTDTIMRPAYATAIGLLLWSAYHTDEMNGNGGAPFAEWRGLRGLREWFRELLP
jgi:cell division protein FtsA